jgi:hypothetical protein
MPRGDINEVVERTLTEVIEGFAARPTQRSRADGQPDIIGRVGERDLVLDVKAVSLSVIEDVLARLSMGALQVRRYAANGAIPMVAVVLPSVGKKVEAAAAAFMAEHAPDVGWALIDREGNARVVVPALRVDLERRTARVLPALPKRASIRLFSDLNRWLLKVLLLADAPAELWIGPRQSVLSGRDLSQAADVSPEMVRRFMNAFEEQDFLRKTPKGLRIVRKSILLDLWRADDALDVRTGVHVRTMMGGAGALQELAGLHGFADAVVVAGFEACRMQGLLHAATAGTVEVHAIDPVADIVERFDLEECTPADADLVLLPSRHPKSVQRGALRRDGLWVADAFQAALDVLRHPARGQEQSDYLLEEVLRLEGGAG